jgi:hypothetical protein
MSEVLPPDHFHPEELMEALVADEVRFILIGGLAVGVHGVVRATRDMDIVPDPDPANLERLAAGGTSNSPLSTASWTYCRRARSSRRTRRWPRKPSRSTGAGDASASAPLNACAR